MGLNIMHSPDISMYCPMYGRSNSYDPTPECNNNIRIHFKFDANGGSGIMLRVNCPKCQHIFALGVCGGEGGGTCRDGLALSGGGLIWPPSSPTLNTNAFFPCQAPPEQDFMRVRNAVERLRMSGWYYEHLTWQASQRALRNAASGTYLIRDSSDHKFLFSLSVQTLKGPTSVRIHYNQGLFRLDAAPSVAAMMPQFDCVVKLIEHYIKVTCNKDKLVWCNSRRNMWIDSEGGHHSPVEVVRPLLAEPPRLLHLARLSVWKSLQNAGSPTLPLLSPIRKLGLPVPLQEYLEVYPYTC